MTFANVERRREYNRTWHRRPRPEGRCEATTKTGRRCSFGGWYDGLHGRVLCNLHARGTP